MENTAFNDTSAHYYSYILALPLLTVDSDSLFIYLFSFATRDGSSPPITPHHPVNFPYGRKPEYPEETYDFETGVDLQYILFISLGLGLSQLKIFFLRYESATLEVKGKRSIHFTACIPQTPLVTPIRDKCTTFHGRPARHFQSHLNWQIMSKPNLNYPSPFTIMY